MVRENKDLLGFFTSLYRQEGDAHFTKTCAQAGEYLIRQHKTVRSIYIIQSGIAKCFVQEENGRSYIQEFFGKGEIVGEIEPLTQSLSFSNIITLTEVEAFKITPSQFYELLRIHPALNLLIIQALATKIRDTAVRAAQQQLHPIDYNLKQLLLLTSQQDITFSKQDLADYLGITLRSLNRSLKNIG